MNFLSKTIKRISDVRSYQRLVSPASRDLEISMAHIINKIVRQNISTCYLHQRTFLPFKGIHTGEDLAIFATGPSSKRHDVIKDCKYIGVNQAYLRKDIEFSYYFVHDNGISDIKKYGFNMLKEINAYRKDKCVKFYGLLDDSFLDLENGSWSNADFEIPESDAIEADALRYRLDRVLLHEHDLGCSFTYDLSTQPLGDFGSVVFPAAQFALWTNPKTLYLIGCDCSSGGHFYETEKTERDTSAYDFMIRPWKLFKKFAQLYYPETKIISINPVGLRGIFEDYDC